MPAYQEPNALTIEQGATFRKTYQYVSSTAPLTPVDITGYTARLQFRNKIADANHVLSLTQSLSPSGQLIIAPTTGLVQIYITDTATMALTGKGVFDLELISPSGDVDRMVQGAYSVSLNVTR